mmetsp:Transcript_3110/g.10407  ORF Transcript_3110/g.10407 Transcript_3110/m.10407 type:complete len:211 (+) Transcript_3110:167-799(+)
MIACDSDQQSRRESPPTPAQQHPPPRPATVERIPYHAPRPATGEGGRARLAAPACRGAAPSDLLEEGLRVRVARLLRPLPDLLEQGDVVADDLELAGDAVGEVVLRRKLRKHLGERRVAVARHRGEEVVLELPLHAAPEHVREPVVALCVARGAELRLDEVVLAQRVAEEDLLALVRHRHDGRRDEPREPHRGEQEPEGHQRREGRPVRR